MDQNFVVTSNNGHEMEGKLPGRSVWLYAERGNAGFDLVVRCNSLFKDMVFVCILIERHFVSGYAAVWEEIEMRAKKGGKFGFGIHPKFSDPWRQFIWVFKRVFKQFITVHHRLLTASIWLLPPAIFVFPPPINIYDDAREYPYFVLKNPHKAVVFGPHKFKHSMWDISMINTLFPQGCGSVTSEARTSVVRTRKKVNSSWAYSLKTYYIVWNSDTGSSTTAGLAGTTNIK